MDQEPLSIVIVLDDTCDKKGSHGPVCVSRPGAGSKKRSCSIKKIIPSALNKTKYYSHISRNMVEDYRLK